MASKLAAWLVIRPAPRTFHESQAIFKAIHKQTAISKFIKLDVAHADTGPSSVKDELLSTEEGNHGSHVEKAGRSTVVTDNSTQPKRRASDLFSDPKTTSPEALRSARYYTLLRNPPPNLVPSIFSVDCYHDVPSAAEVDPFNIRGFHDRKPFPAIMTFDCKLKVISADDVMAAQFLKDSRWRRGFGPESISESASMQNGSDQGAEADTNLDPSGDRREADYKQKAKVIESTAENDIPLSQAAFTTALGQMRAPPGIREGIPDMEANGVPLSPREAKYKTPMDSLMGMWGEPINEERENVIREGRRQMGIANELERQRAREEKNNRAKGRDEPNGDGDTKDLLPRHAFNPFR